MDENGRPDEATDVLASIRRLVADEAEKALAPGRKTSEGAEPSSAEAPEEQAKLPRADSNRDWLIGVVNHGRRAGSGDTSGGSEAPAAKEIARFLRDRKAKIGPRFALLRPEGEDSPDAASDDAVEGRTEDAGADDASELQEDQAPATQAGDEAPADPEEPTEAEPAVTFSHRAPDPSERPQAEAPAPEPEAPPAEPEEVAEAQPAPDTAERAEDVPDTAADDAPEVAEAVDAEPDAAGAPSDAVPDAAAAATAKPEPLEETHTTPKAAPESSDPQPAEQEAAPEDQHGFTPWDRASLAEGLRQLDQRAPPGAPVRLLLTDEFRIEGAGDVRPMFARSPARRYTEDSDVTDPVPSSPMPTKPLELGTAPDDATTDDTDPGEPAKEAAPAADDDEFIDEDTLRALVADIVRQELQGALGERITRNVRKLVRAEIAKAFETYALTLEVPGPDTSTPGSSDPNSG